jgi:hypothetical protein
MHNSLSDVCRRRIIYCDLLMYNFGGMAFFHLHHAFLLGEDNILWSELRFEETYTMSFVSRHSRVVGPVVTGRVIRLFLNFLDF